MIGRLLLLALAFVSPRLALAASDCDGESGLSVDCIFDDTSFTGLDVPTIAQNIVTVLKYTVLPVAAALFALGAFLYIVSLDKEERKNQGKEFMIGALIGVGVVYGAQGILNTVLYWLYGGF